MEEYFGVAKDLGVSDEEIGAMESIVMAVSAGQVRAKFREARDRVVPRSSDGTTSS